MGRRQNRYAGYRSFSYLRAGEDYTPYDLPPEIDRVASTRVAVTEAQEERVWQLLDRYPVISLHEHADLMPLRSEDVMPYTRQGRDFTGYEGLSVSGLDCVFDNLMDGTTLITSSAGWKWTDIIHDLGMRLSDIEHQDFVVRAGRVADIERAKREGQVAFIPALEAATAIENEVDRVDVLYGLGVRLMGIAYSEANGLGSGLAEATDGGLTSFGRRVVRRMNRLGMAVDISHCGDRTSLDTIAASAVPVFITHAGARGVWPSRRMKSDEVVRACAERGGVIGIEAAPHTTLSREHPRHTIDSVMDHFTYLVDLVGIDHVAFGPDTLFGDHVALHGAFAAQFSIDDAHGAEGPDDPAFPPVDFVDGLESPAEAFPNLVRWLVAHGYGDGEIGKVIGGNVMRVLGEVWR